MALDGFLRAMNILTTAMFMHVCKGMLTIVRPQTFVFVESLCFVLDGASISSVDFGNLLVIDDGVPGPGIVLRSS